MSRQTRLQYRSILNWLLLWFNALLLLFLVFHWLLPLGRSVVRARKDAAKLGMDVYFVRSPFTLLVNKDFPHNEAFMLFEHGQPFVISGEDVDEKGAEPARTVSLGLGTDFSISCDYSPADNSLTNGTHVHDLVLHRRNEAFFDLNVDGSFDMRHVRDEEQHVSHTYVRHQGKWQETVWDGTSSKYKRRLVGGGTVSFDMKSGLWVSPAEKSGPEREKETTRP